MDPDKISLIKVITVTSIVAVFISLVFICLASVYIVEIIVANATSDTDKTDDMFTTSTQDQLDSEYIYLEPVTSTSPGETHSSSVATTKSYKDFDLTADVITFRQLRQNSPPNNWETAWLNWNAIDQFHSYGFTLKIKGNQLEKKDNTNEDDSAEIFLVTQDSPSVKMNTWQKWQIRITGTETGIPRIQIWIDGTKIVDYVEDQPGIQRNSEIMKKGGPIVLYTEDAAVGFDNIKIKSL